MNPKYFSAPGRVPTSDIAQLINKYGIHADDMGGAGIRTMTKDGKNVAYTLPTGGSPAGYLETAKQIGDADTAARLERAIKQGHLTPTTKFVGADMTGAESGAGGAKAMYPAIIEHTIANPDSALISATGLTFPNMIRKSLAMSGGIEKFGDRAANRLLIDSDQLGPLGSDYLENAYQALPTEAKVGLLNAKVAPDTIGKVNKNLSWLSTADRGADVDKMLTEARSLGLTDSKWNPSTDVSPDYYPRLAQLMQDLSRSQGVSQTVGIDSLRRAGLTTDALTQGVTAADIASQPYLTNGIARKKGGSIPANKAGPLSQMCGYGQG
jgi:hypothetical protein